MNTKITATNTYGIHALVKDIGTFELIASNLISNLLTHCTGQLSLGAKSQVSLGIKNPALAANVTIGRPINAPINDGNSAPKKIPVNA